MLNTAKTCGEAVVVCDHHGRVEGREVEHDDGILVESRLGFHDERDALWCLRSRPLLDTGRHCDVIPALSLPQHHGLDSIL